MSARFVHFSTSDLFSDTPTSQLLSRRQTRHHKTTAPSKNSPTSDLKRDQRNPNTLDSLLLHPLSSLPPLFFPQQRPPPPLLQSPPESATSPTAKAVEPQKTALATALLQQVAVQVGYFPSHS